MLYWFVVSVPNAEAALPLIVRSTTHCSVFCWRPVVTLVMSLPSKTALSRTYLPPLASHETIWLFVVVVGGGGVRVGVADRGLPGSVDGVGVGPRLAHQLVEQLHRGGVDLGRVPVVRRGRRGRRRGRGRGGARAGRRRRARLRRRGWRSASSWRSATRRPRPPGRSCTMYACVLAFVAVPLGVGVVPVAAGVLVAARRAGPARARRRRAARVGRRGLRAGCRCRGHTAAPRGSAAGRWC